MRLLLSTAAALAIVAAAGGIAQAEYRLTILHTNDFHSRIEPINKYDSTCSAEEATADACFGGSARLFTAIRAARESATNPILVDGGDQFQGSLFYNHYKGKAAAEMMNAIGYDAMTVGNHEFDDGPEVLRAFIEAVDFPILLANADVSKEPELAETLKPWAVIERGGEKIGLVGVTPVNTAELSSPGPRITFQEPVAALTEAVEALTDQGVDKIVVLSHSGYEADKRIAAAVPGIDVIVGGHSHTLLANNDDKASGPYPTMVKGPDGHDVPIVQAYAYGKYLGELVVTFDDAGVVTEASGTPLIMNGTIPQDSTLVARIDELAKPLEAIRTKVVARTAAPLDGAPQVCRIGECSMGNLVADAMLDRVRDQGASLAITNGGGLRASIDEGEVTMGEVLMVLPFQNTLSTFKLTGADIRAALENGVSQVEEGGGRFPQVSGLKFTWSMDAAPGSRIGTVEVMEEDAFVPLDPAKTYLVVSNNFLRGGGDGYSVFAEKGLEAYDYGPTLDDVVAAYLSRDSAQYEPYTDGRITLAE
ncbi:MAG: bifunctional metallophosphatase/5'-nucleotidase [Aurantimonas endophytica]|uniref:bifunctional metallophosphatase/5'-nucleotidase n=1 Tax=Aurantimonas endophytica TaxID=1522175 RepID=UPI003002CE57